MLIPLLVNPVFYRPLTGIHCESRWSFPGITVTGHIAIPLHGIDLCGSHLTCIEIDGAGKTVCLIAIVRPAEIEHARDPILAPRVVVDIRPPKRDVPRAESIIGLLLHRILTHLD